MPRIPDYPTCEDCDKPTLAAQAVYTKYVVAKTTIDTHGNIDYGNEEEIGRYETCDYQFYCDYHAL